jgi:hypothetical protein
VPGEVAAEEIGGSGGEVKAGSARSSGISGRDLLRATGCCWMQRYGLRPGREVILAQQPASVAVRPGTRASETAHAITHTPTDTPDEA